MTTESEELFNKYYKKVIEELDALARGVFDQSEGAQMAAVCLLARNYLIKTLGEADLRANSLKHDIKFAQAEAYVKNKNIPGEKKPTDVGLTHLINKDDNVNKTTKEQLVAVKEAKDLDNILDLLKDAHITFRSFIKKDN